MEEGKNSSSLAPVLFHGLYSCSQKMFDIFRLVEQYAKSNYSVLICGESGTGKEKLARAIHDCSLRKEKPFIAINCSAIPEGLLESNLFGHKKGSFTGALYDREGLFEAASEGTLFLDEIADMPIFMQAKILRALQEKEITPVGSTKPIRIKTRIICATHKNIQKEMSEGRFRKDLYFRLNTLPIDVPSLNERPEDIELLAHYFLEKSIRENHLCEKRISESSLRLLRYHVFKGNVRELEGMIQRAAILSGNKPVIDLEITKDTRSFEISSDEFNLKKIFENIERKLIQTVLEKTGRNRTKSAKLLNISVRSLLTKIKEYQL